MANDAVPAVVPELCEQRVLSLIGHTSPGVRYRGRREAIRIAFSLRRLHAKIGYGQLQTAGLSI